KKLGIRHCQVSLFVPPGNVRPSEMLRSPATKAKATRQRGAKIDHVWMLSYECAGIAQAGGLGEAVAGLARTLSSDYGLRVTVLLPSHGRHSEDRKSTRLNSSHVSISYAVFCLKKK